MTHSQQRGLSLIELLVSLAIGAFLIIGAVTMQSQTRNTFAVNEQQARLQETARYVVSVIEPELQLAGLFGFSNQASGVSYKIGGIDKSASEMRIGKAAIGAPAVVDSCGVNYVLDVLRSAQADNGTWTMSCAAGGGGKLAGTDVLMIRHASVEEQTPSKTKLQIYTNRLVPADQRLFVGDAAPGPLKADVTEVRDMVFQSYYVAVNAENRPGVPALRIKQLTTDGTNPGWQDQEVIRGVEDIQVEFGVDPGQDLNKDGLPDTAGGIAISVNGDARLYVAPDNAFVTSGQVVSVRFWVRVRAEEPEPGFKDTRTYNYANVSFTANDNFRRVLMSRTIFLRNSRAQPEGAT